MLSKKELKEIAKEIQLNRRVYEQNKDPLICGDNPEVMWKFESKDVKK